MDEGVNASFAIRATQETTEQQQVNVLHNLEI